MGFLKSAEVAYPKEETASSNRGTAETNHILTMLEAVSRGGKRYRPFAGSVSYCPRENWFHANLEKAHGQVIPATLNLYQGIGNGVEERIVKGMAEHNRLLGTQVKLPNPRSILRLTLADILTLWVWTIWGVSQRMKLRQLGLCRPVLSRSIWRKL